MEVESGGDEAECGGGGRLAVEVSGSNDGGARWVRKWKYSVLGVS